MEKYKIDRINELARKAKSEGLTEEETEERRGLRMEYLLDIRQSLSSQLDNTYIKEPDGSLTPLAKKEEK